MMASALLSGAPPARRGAGHPRPDGKAEEEPIVELSATTTTPPAGMRGPASPAVLLPGPLSPAGARRARSAAAGAPEAASEPRVALPPGLCRARGAVTGVRDGGPGLRGVELGVDGPRLPLVLPHHQDQHGGQKRQADQVADQPDRAAADHLVGP